MVAQFVLNAALFGLSSTVLASPTTAQRGDYVNWRKFHANGVNLGGWLAQEATIDPYWWDQHCRGTVDEWNCCVQLGDQCDSVFEKRYATYITSKDIDKLASGGINLIRIPTTYAAWIDVPGAGYHSGNQQKYFKRVADYAIKKYGMHVVLDLHSLPGGVNGLDIGERVGKWEWFNSTKNLDLSLDVVDAALNFIQKSGSPQSYSLAPINEPADNPDFSKFGTPAALSDAGSAWVLKYFKAVLQRAEAVNCKIPVMLQGSFKGEPFWSPSFDKSDNIVFDVHNYYFGRLSDSDNVTSLLCADAKRLAGDGKFPVFVGEWSIQTSTNNRIVNRAKNVNTGLYAYNKFTQGNSYWTAKFRGNVTVAGEGTQSEYWNYESFIDAGFLDEKQGKKYCS
ncbi:glycoside hydrolase superfamily [Boeremia exigua]|uniref:glycoside hydrolase superfamily n=1 Tax=Boeremia exigua TaxID=749465 RepID=UPI001E8EBF30|nr:glycoside hydrolase superfamily [Boeremia exigua]KAH6642272.1 glycoside hydrolase superfamily [Boeremia exigua]